ncbi:hypothetical protein ACPXCE_11920 [Streptomyces sp. DT24]|uniref:hypothetical protein n=1 Tax=unclassified Streptomyces TaxID=2593676 RepID=UPI0023B8E9E4|nr:hypothetical protein [Streptomyces sp. AM 4-1-1]WEH34328.1 hypothetical protein PZB75_13765 [Streptomyces sp. AM 4-1-1]
MSTVPPHVVSLARMLAAATRSEPRVTETPTKIRIEADLPDQVSGVMRATILRALSSAPRFGHDRAQDSETIWAEIDKEPP